MNSTEFNGIITWSKRNMNSYHFSERDIKVDSYYESFDSDLCIMSYGFDTLPELEMQFEDMWRDERCFDGLSRICAIATFKNNPTKELSNSKDSDKDSKEFSIPEYIYVF